MTSPAACPRRRRDLLIALAGMAGLGAWPLAWGAEPAGVGATLAARTLENQHGLPLPIDAATRRLVFSTEKAVSDWVHAALSPWGAAGLEQAGIVCVADISAMPALITRMFALPKLRELPIAIGLAREAGVLADLPRRPGLATAVRLDRLQVLEVQYLPDAPALAAWLQT
jgi:hypothetical protein